MNRNLGHKRGKKYQTTVRFSNEILSELERISEAKDLSLAEVVRRFVRQAMGDNLYG
jgi:hypothetical protein